jgi:predicted nucleotide-binding protein (sugar kinase/HSP70/actin superfamily)
MDMEEVVDKTTSFIEKSGYSTFKLVSVKLDKETKEWVVKFDVGAFMTLMVTVIVDDATGRVISYDRSY